MRSVYDEILYHGGIRSFPIDNSLLLSCQTAGTKYKNELQRKKEESNKSNNDNKRKQLGEELSIIKKKKVEMEDLAKELDADADKFISKAGDTEIVVEMKTFVTKANAFKKSAKEKRDAIAEFKSTIGKMEEELSSFSQK